MQVLPESAVIARLANLHIPIALVKMARMQPGPLTVANEAGNEWRTHLRQYSESGVHEGYNVFRGWRAIVAALQLEAGQSICLAAPSPSRLLISRQGEPHFMLAVAAQGFLGPWPLNLRLSESSARQDYLLLSLATGQTICHEGALDVPAVMPSGFPSAAEPGVKSHKPLQSSWCFKGRV